MRRRHLAFGLLFGSAAVAAWALYSRRPLARVAGPEGLDDPEVARGYGWVSRTPQMALMRRLVANRAAGMMPLGAAVDLGCGPGLLTIKLAQTAPGLRVTGVDLSPEMLAQAEEHAWDAALSDRVDFRLGDASRMPFADGSLDLAVSTLSLHHWSDPVAVLNEIARVLRPGGAFLIADLRRDMPPPFYLLVWFATKVVVPPTLRRIGEPLASRNAAYDPYEIARLAQASRLTGWSMTTGPLWLIVEGKMTGA